MRHEGRRLKPSSWRRGRNALFCALFWAAIAPLPAPAQVNVLTYHNDNARTGQNLNETNLTLANVNSNTFGLLFSYAVDSATYAQPLYMAAVTITNKGIHNVVFAATENDSVYAFDADSNTAPLWQASFINPAAGVTIVPGADVGQPPSLAYGITSTPVIDPSSMTLYVQAKTKEVSGTTTNYVDRLHALDLGSGAEKFGGPVVIQPVVAGTGEGNDGSGNVPFTGQHHLNRSGLLLANGVVYVAYGSFSDVQPYHGWVLGFNAQTLQPQGVFNSTPNGGLGGFWETGDGPATDAEGNIYLISGNGTFDGATNGDFADSYIKLTPNAGNLILADYFTPYNQQYLAINGLDAGSGGLVVLPDALGSLAHPHLAVGAGKDGIIHLVDRDAFGEYNPTNNNQIVQSLAAIGPCLSTPAFFNNTLYYIAKSDTPKAFSFSDGLLETSPSSTNGTVFLRGATPSISANGTSNAILWALEGANPAVLHAFNATNLALELYNSQQTGLRDALGPPLSFVLPTVSNGKVYVCTGSALSVFGIGLWYATPGISPDGGVFTNSVTVTLTSNAPAGPIYYTLDDTTPTTNSERYSAPLTLTNTTIVQAIAAGPGVINSPVAAALFISATSTPAGPVISPDGGIFTNSVVVTLISNALGGQIYYTLDGTTPTTNSEPYSAPLKVTNTTILQAIAAVPNEDSSPVAAALFIASSPSNNIAGFGGNGSGWALNGGAVVTNDVLTLTDGLNPEARSAYFDSPEVITAFHIQFVYQASGLADGAAFVLQNAVDGTNASGGCCGGLGYSGIAPSAAIEFNIYSGSSGGMGTRFATNGLTMGYTSTLPVNLSSDDPIWVTLNYTGASLAEDLVDLVTGATFATNYVVNLPAAVGGSNTAFVGFTGSDGGVASIQTISDFTFVSLSNATPGISPDGGIFTNSVKVTLISNSLGGQIYYTLDGTTPTSNSEPYSAPLTLTNTTILKAIAAVPNEGSSPVAVALFIASSPSNNIAGFGGNGSGWALNGGAAATNNILTLTDGLNPEARSAYFDSPQFIAAFHVQFVYQGSGFADGAAFVLQNAADGTSALGSCCGGLGYGGISPSAAIEFNIYSGSSGGMGTRFATNGLTMGYTSTLPVNLGSDDPIWVMLNYDGSNLAEVLMDLLTEATFETNYMVNLPTAVGGSNTAFVGFTGSDGGLPSIQTISDFTFGPNGPAPALSASVEGKQLRISWPASALNYVLELTTNLAAPTVWTVAPQTPVVSASQATATVPIGATNTFFRLVAP